MALHVVKKNNQALKKEKREKREKGEEGKRKYGIFKEKMGKNEKK